MHAHPRPPHRLTAVAASCVVAFSLTSCSLVTSAVFNDALALQDALEKASGSDNATLRVGALYPDAERVVLVCPYNGHAANQVLGTDAFDTYEDANDGSNWVVLRKRGGATVKVEMDRTQVDVCVGPSDGVVDVDPADSLTFTQSNGTWVLVGVEG